MITIKPKRWDFLTIPLVPEAKGLYAAAYVRKTGKKLFRPRRSNGTLCHVLSAKDPSQKCGFRNIYILDR